ncbi:MAG: hypothetical protein ABSG56_07860 [Bryobacteraceae bacterium]|jgi:hypothetical protein
MLTLDPGRLTDLAIPIGTARLLGACMEARGTQDLWIRQKPEVLEILREQAIVQYCSLWWGRPSHFVVCRLRGALGRRNKTIVCTTECILK